MDRICEHAIHMYLATWLITHLQPDLGKYQISKRKAPTATQQQVTRNGFIEWHQGLRNLVSWGYSGWALVPPTPSSLRFYCRHGTCDYPSSFKPVYSLSRNLSLTELEHREKKKKRNINCYMLISQEVALAEMDKCVITHWLRHHSCMCLFI